MAYTARTIDAAEALKIGLVINLLPSGRELEEVKLIANQIAQGPPKAMALTKANFERAAQIGLEATFALEETTQGICICGEEHREGRQAFFEKRKPSF